MTPRDRAKVIIEAIKENRGKPGFSWFDYESEIAFAIEEAEKNLILENAQLKDKIIRLEGRHEICPYCGYKSLQYILEDNCTYALCATGPNPCGLKDFVGTGDLRDLFRGG
jgi:hypothetical protein